MSNRASAQGARARIWKTLANFRGKSLTHITEKVRRQRKRMRLRRFHPAQSLQAFHSCETMKEIFASALVATERAMVNFLGSRLGEFLSPCVLSLRRRNQPIETALAR
jgi:hypothetical protein